jgi:hypothetical protein
MDTDDLNVRPHPGLLPRGEGETFASFLECRESAIGGCAPCNRKRTAAVPSPWGEGQGEGGLKNKLKNPTERRRRGIVVERRPQKDEATSGAADWEDVAPDGA